jgi:alkylation response protein AidB-like acyl-CoA dehydrogenase
MTHGSRLDDEDRLLLGATIERLAERHVDINRCQAAEIVCADDEWAAFAEQGVFGIGIDADYGGIGGGVGEIALMMRQIGEKLLAVPYMDGVVLGASLIATLGSEAQKLAILPAIAAGEIRLGFAHREPNSGDLIDFVETRANGNNLSGFKTQVMDGVRASRFLVSARDESEVLRFYLVDRDAPGLTVQNYRIVDNRLVAKLTLADVSGEPIGGDAALALEAVYDTAAVCVAAETVGAMVSLNRDTLDYAKVRKQFGQSIGSFQVLQHRLVDLFIAEQTAHALVTDALSALEVRSASAKADVSAAKAQADRLGRQVGEAAIQIHGGMGMTDECAVGHYLKRILVNGSQFRTSGWHVARISQVTA